MSQTVPDLLRLSPWIQARHLTPEAVAAHAARYRASAGRFVVLDDFLNPARLAAIRALVLEDGEMTPFYKLYGSNDWVDATRFEAAQDAQRFISETIYTRPKPGREMAPSTLADAGFRLLLGSDALRAYLGAIVGKPLKALQLVNLKCLGPGHFLRPHSDGVGDRAACMVLYLHADWQPAYRGRFVMYRGDGGCEYVDPFPNRLLLFDPHAGTRHAVEAMADDLPGWVRLNYTAWFR